MHRSVNAHTEQRIGFALRRDAVSYGQPHKTVIIFTDFITTDFAALPESRSCPRISQRRIVPLDALISWRSLRRRTYPFQTVMQFSSCIASRHDHCSEKSRSLPYIQEVGNYAEKRKFPRSWKLCVIIGVSVDTAGRKGDADMYVKLSIPERLKDLRAERHLTLEQLATETGLSKSALGRYESDEYKDISPFAIATLTDFYGVSADYLMGLTETKNHSNTALHELHLSDNMIDVLKDGKLNNRLLCEIVTHEGFQRFLVDAEIHIDRIADMRINDMNTVLAAVRQQVIQENDPGENDLYMRTLEVAQIQESEYFSHIAAEDMGEILKDIREKHKTDTTTADTDSTATGVQRQLQEAITFKGSEQERQIRVFCAQLGIPYDKLTKEQFVNLIEILKLSDYMKSPYSQRGRAKLYQSHSKGKKKRK